MNYTNFKEYILRTPLLSIDYFLNLTASNEISEVELKNLFTNPVIKESIFLASPELFSEMEKWIEGNLNTKEITRIKYSFLKYISRACSRCTPFGLFAGCSIGEISNTTNIILKEYNKNGKTSRFDMEFLVKLSNKISALDHIKSQLNFYPNNTIYQIEKNYRYIEYYFENGIKHHQIVSVTKTKHLKKILNICNKGAKISEIVDEIKSENVTTEIAENYINQLIESKFIVSELEPSITGIDYLEQLIKVLNKKTDTFEIVQLLSFAKAQLHNIDKKIGNNTIEYKKIITELEKFESKINLKHLFQTDMSVNFESNLLDYKIIEKVKKGIEILRYFNKETKNKNLEEFKKKFIERFENREIQLSKVLDTEIGVGYIQNDNQGDVNPLVDDLNYSIPNKNPQNLPSANYHPLIIKKIQEGNLKNKYSIKLEESDFKDYSKFDLTNLPSTISTTIQLLKINNEEKIKFNFIGGSSGANLLARFCTSDTKIEDHVRNIISFENKQLNKNEVLAEIIHLPESRVGNVLIRPDFREYEIPYLGNSLLNKEKQIMIDDIYVSIENGKIILKSKKLNKRIIPRLTNAHNFNNNSLPIYNFLCDLQNNENSNYVYFELGNILSEYTFIPRIEFEDIVLQEATWNINIDNLKNLYKFIDDDVKILNEISLLQKELNIPNLIYLVEGDNKLLINLKNITSLKMFLFTVKSLPNIKITEYLFENESEVKNLKGENFNNEIILTFHKVI